MKNNALVSLKALNSSTDEHSNWWQTASNPFTHSFQLNQHTKQKSLCFFSLAYATSLVSWMDFCFQWEFIFRFDQHRHSEGAYFCLCVRSLAATHICHWQQRSTSFRQRLCSISLGVSFESHGSLQVDQVNFNSIFSVKSVFAFIWEINTHFERF